MTTINPEGHSGPCAHGASGGSEGRAINPAQGGGIRGVCADALSPEGAAPAFDEIERSVTRDAWQDQCGGIGVLLVNHGSHAASWRRMLLDVHAETADRLLAIEGVTQVRTAFMEYTEPSIATQLRGFDRDGIGTVIVVPLLLTVSGHSLEDIPTICGMRSEPEGVEHLRKEGIEIYAPRADLVFAPLLDFPDMARKNLVRRLHPIVRERRESRKRPGRDGLVLVGYGSAECAEAWDRFFAGLGCSAEAALGIAGSAHAWCGHVVRYSSTPTTDEIRRMLRRTDRVIVVPELVAYDPMLQGRIIARGVARAEDPERVLYTDDAILPEPEVGRWIVRITRRLARRVVDARSERIASAGSRR